MKKFYQSIIILLLVIIILGCLLGYTITTDKDLTNTPFIPGLHLQEITDLILNGLPRLESLFTNYGPKSLPFPGTKITIMGPIFQSKWSGYPLLSVYIVMILFFLFFYRQTRDADEHLDCPQH